ncbi:hypothetical protein SMD20_47965 [Nonomuraea sp. LP-02]|nr:hypothetical protein [Nonomuraea sp. LP-02]MED7932027.1 hypothetical protein [Nonomuraea sp. LP-02]
MHVVAGVPESDPSAGVEVSVRGDAGGVDELSGDLRPGGVGERPVVASGQGGAVPDAPDERPGVALGGAVEVRGQVVEGRVGMCRVGLERVPGGDQVRVALLPRA